MLDRIPMLDWLKEQRQPPRAIERFWRQIPGEAAISEELDATAASCGFQVFRLGLLARSDSYQMGVPSVPLGEFYGGGEMERTSAPSNSNCALRWSGS